jgi:hypothetical protein
MPYEIKKVAGGFKVAKKQPGRKKYFSGDPLTREKAVAQMRAIILSEQRRK